MKLDSLSSIGDGLYVSKSTIQNSGNGLFSSKTFRKGSYITLYDGENITRKEALSRTVLTHMASREGVIIDGLKFPVFGRGGGSFCNATIRQKDANAEIVGWLGLILIRAKKCILSNDEILVYYGRRGFKIACDL